MCTHLYTHTHKHTYTFTHMYTIYMYTHTHIYIYIYTYTYTYIFTYMCIYIYIYIPASLNSMIGGGDISGSSGISICTNLHIYTCSIQHVYMQSYYTNTCVNTHTYTYT